MDLFGITIPAIHDHLLFGMEQSIHGQAAGLWTTAFLGITIGAGYLIAAVVAFVLIYFVMTVLTRQFPC